MDELRATVDALVKVRDANIEACRKALPSVAKTDAQRALAAKHGTPAAFAAAVWNALGDISVDEAESAIAHYLCDWDAAR